MSKKNIGQLIMIGVSGTSLTSEEKKFIVDNDICGVTLFGRNVKEPKQIHELCSEIQSLRHLTASKAPLYVAVDMEGGRVARMRNPFTVWPPLRRLGELDSTTLSFEFGQTMGTELKAVGFNVDWAPDADVLTNPKNTAIGDRSIGSDAELVAKHASALVRGYLKAGIVPCVKHFPGHGNTVLDSHNDLPSEDIDLATLKTREFVPFQKAFRAKCDMLMTCHIIFKKIDPEWPVTLSKKFLTDILRGELAYRGLIVTDDLGMKAMADHYGASEIPVRAIQAGANLLLYCNEPESPPIALEALKKAVADKTLSEEQIKNCFDLISAHKKEHLKNPDPASWTLTQNLVGHADHKAVAAKLI